MTGSGGEGRGVWPGEHALGRNEVHVFRIPLPGPVDRVLLERTLSPDERKRGRRFVSAEDGRRFVAARAALRCVLARYAGEPPERLGFSYGPRGKPALASGGALRFNLAHSGSLALVAVALGREVGIDVERVRANLEFERLSERFFSEAERTVFFGLREDLRRRAFFRCWVLKEAYLKARGDGLALPLDSFDVSFGPEGRPLVVATRPDVRERERFSLAPIDAGPEYEAALAFEGNKARLILFDFDWAVFPGTGAAPHAFSFP